MAWASRSGRARTSASHPEAFGVCQRCGIWYNRVNLRNQMEWRGSTIMPTWLFVCDRCYDTPFEPDRVIVPPADPVPVQLALPENFDAASTTAMGLADRTIDPRTGIPVPGKTVMKTTGGVIMGPTPVGRPNGYAALDRAPVVPVDVINFMAETTGVFMARTDGVFMATELKGATTQPGTVPPLPDDAKNPPRQFGSPLPVLSIMANGTPLVTVNCRAPHGLALNDQVGVQGSGNALADGLFSVIPITATAFTYGTYSPVPARSLLEQHTLVLTVLIGLPRSHAQVPQTGLMASQTPPTRTSQ